jgi:hypothetical protein
VLDKEAKLTSKSELTLKSCGAEQAHLKRGKMGRYKSQ